MHFTDTSAAELSKDQGSDLAKNNSGEKQWFFSQLISLLQSAQQ